jgi:geranylgeranyl pyrophosphate synthase
VIDGARTRKGRQAANTIWGNKSAVIMGDHFFVLAFTRLTELNDLKLIKLFVDTCRYLAEGVMLEIKHQRDLKVTEEIHTDIITRKTATFFETACVAGGYLGGADEDEQEILATLGMNFGLAFQMSDDLLDLFADPDATGKPRGTDLNAGIYTVPVIHALKDNSNFQDRFIKDLSGETLNPEIILDIADTIRKNGSYEYSISEVRRYSKIALDALDKLPDNSANESFRALINKIVERDYV